MKVNQTSTKIMTKSIYAPFFSQKEINKINLPYKAYSMFGISFNGLSHLSSRPIDVFNVGGNPFSVSWLALIFKDRVLNMMKK